MSEQEDINRSWREFRQNWRKEFRLTLASGTSTPDVEKLIAFLEANAAFKVAAVFGYPERPNCYQSGTIFSLN